jgi:hypothetical protein
MPDEPANDQQPVAAGTPEEPADSGAAFSGRFPDVADVLRTEDMPPVEEVTAEEAAPVEEADSDTGDADDTADESDEEAPEEGADQDKPGDRSRPGATQRLRQRLEQVQTEAQQHKSRLDTLERTQLEAEAEILKSYGADNEWALLYAKRMDPNQTLSYDEEERYRQMVMANRLAASKILKAAESLGVAITTPPDETDIAAVQQEIISAAKAQATEEWKDERAKLVADNQSMATKLASRAPDPGTGGRSAAYVRKSDDQFDPHALSSDNLRRALSDLNDSR